MAVFDMPRPRFTAEDMDDEKQRKKIISWLVQLDEKLRYMLENIDEENLSAQMSDTIKMIAQGVEDSKAVVEVLPDQVRIAVSTLQEEIDGLNFDEFETAGSEILLTATEARISTPEFTVNIRSEGETTGLKIDRNGAEMETLIVNNELHAPNIVERYTGPAEITLQQGDSLQAALDTINGKQLQKTVTITLDASAYFVESLYIHDITGSGQLNIVGGDANGKADLYGVIFIGGCSAKIFITYLDVVPYARNNSVLAVDRSDYVWAENCVFDGSAANNNYAVTGAIENAKLVLVNDILYLPAGSAGSLMFTANGGEILANNVKGSGDVFLRAGFAKVIMSGTRPMGSYVEQEAGTVFALPADPASLTADDGNYTHIVPITAEDVTVVATESKSWNGGVWTDHSLEQGLVREWNATTRAWVVDDYRGVMWFDRQELEDLGSSIERATLTLQKLYNDGKSVNVWAYAVALEEPAEAQDAVDPAQRIITRGQGGPYVGGLIGMTDGSEETTFTDSNVTDIVKAIASYARAAGENRKNFGILLYTGEKSSSAVRGESVNRASFIPAWEHSDNPPKLTVTVVRNA